MLPFGVLNCFISGGICKMYKVVIFSNNFYMVKKSCNIFFNNRKEKRQFFKKEIFYHGVEIITTREITKTTFRRVHLWAG